MFVRKTSVHARRSLTCDLVTANRSASPSSPFLPPSFWDSSSPAYSAPRYVCRHCQQPATRCTTRVSNRKGNAGRPYIKCFPCDNFIRFTDERGVHATNPTCNCDKPSRLQRAGRETRVNGRLHYVCSSGGCDYFEEHRNAAGRAVIVEEDLIELMIRMRII